MDLVRIMHMVDTPSAGKCDFNYLCSWFDIVHSDPLGISSVWYILIFFLCTVAMCTQCPWLVHAMVLASCFKSFRSHICVVDISSEPRFNVHVLSIVVVMHPVDMCRFCLPLCSIIWCRLADCPAAQTLHTQIDTCIFWSNIHL